jgi:hypothetical protein
MVMTRLDDQSNNNNNNIDDDNGKVLKSGTSCVCVVELRCLDRFQKAKLLATA